jgi:hypothetical protein
MVTVLLIYDIQVSFFQFMIWIIVWLFVILHCKDLGIILQSMSLTTFISLVIWRITSLCWSLSFCETESMGKSVPPKIAVPTELFLAVETIIWFDVCVSQQMSLEIWPLIEWSTTSVTFVRWLFQMKDLVNLKGSWLTESFSTVWTFERLFLRVNVSVISQMILSSESFVTNVTSVGSLICMSPLVNQEIVWFSEMSITVFANELFLGSRGSPS